MTQQLCGRYQLDRGGTLSDRKNPDEMKSVAATGRLESDTLRELSSTETTTGRFFS